MGKLPEERVTQDRTEAGDLGLGRERWYLDSRWDMHVHRLLCRSQEQPCDCGSLPSPLPPHLRQQTN